MLDLTTISAGDLSVFTIIKGSRMFSITQGMRRLGLCKPVSPLARLQSSYAGGRRDRDRETVDITNQPIAQPYAPEFEQKRILPVHSTFYAENPVHEQNMRELNDLLRKYIKLPTVPDKVGKWITYQQYQSFAGGQRLRPGEHRDLKVLLTRLNKIDTQLIPQDLHQLLTKYTRADTTKDQTKEAKTLDKLGRSRTLGGRKEATAIVYMVKGNGEFLVNGRSLNNVFRRLAEREDILYPLKVVESEGEYNIFVTVEGGGFSGKAGAIANGIAKGLVIHNPLLKPRLYKAGCMTRDSRVKERKKPGKRKARKSPTWVKR